MTFEEHREKLRKSLDELIDAIAKDFGIYKILDWLEERL